MKFPRLTFGFHEVMGGQKTNEADQKQMKTVN